MYPESDRAARLIDFILNKVELARECYNKFIKVLEEDKHTNEVVLKLLKNTYKPLIPGGKCMTFVYKNSVEYIPFVLLCFR